jgi:predicted phosphodiesterase
MDMIFRARWLVLIALTPLIAGCYSFIGRYGEPFYAGKDPAYFERLVDKSFTPESLGPDFTYKLAADEKLSVIDESPGFLRQCLASPAILRFAWLSDVQLRQKEVKLFDDDTSLTLDNIIPSFEHNPVQEDYDWAVFTSFIAAINRLNKSRDYPIDFTVHTGDSIDAGTIEEIYQYVYIANHLNTPWLNVVGNHDISIFGNYRERLGYTRQAGVNFYPVGNFSNYLMMHGKDRMLAGFGPNLLPVPAGGGHSPSEDGAPAGNSYRIPPTYYHGFDYGIGTVPKPPPPDVFQVPDVPGYYAFDIDLASVPMRIIALNSAKAESWGADGQITERQRVWLQQMMDSAQGRLLLIFSHHRPLDFDEKTMEVLYQQRSGAMVFFTGHTHRHHVKHYSSLKGRGFYELNTGSVLEYPQLGRLIEIRGTRGGTMCLVSRSLWTSHLEQNPDIPADDSLNNDLVDCMEKRMEYRSSLSKAAGCGHIGALKDYRDNSKMFWSKPQSIEDASKAANIVLPIRYDQ